MNESTKNQIIAEVQNRLERARNGSTETSIALNIGVIFGIEYALERLGYRFEHDECGYSNIVEA